MKETISLSIFGAIFAILVFLFRNAGQENAPMKLAKGIIDRSVTHDGITNCFISFYESGTPRYGKSVGYHESEHKHIPAETTVDIGYRETKAGRPRVIILGAGLTSTSHTAKQFPKVLMWISISFFAVAAVFVLRNILL